MCLSFQINGTEYAYINSAGINITGNIAATTCNIVDTTGNSLIIGTGSNKWLFNTYTSASFLQLQSFAIGGAWSNTLFGLDCYGNVSFSGNLNCNKIQTSSTISSINGDPSQTTISAGYVGENQLISSLPGYDTHRWTFNMRGYDTMYTQSDYLGNITNVLYGTTTINTLNCSNLTITNIQSCLLYTSDAADE